MTVLSEGDLRLTLPGRTSGRSFDDEQHGLSHCMAAVDWILNPSEQIYFVEVKDPEDPGAKKYGNATDFLQNFLADKLTRKLSAKFATRFCTSGPAIESTSLSATS